MQYVQYKDKQLHRTTGNWSECRYNADCTAMKICEKFRFLSLLAAALRGCHHVCQGELELEDSLYVIQHGLFVIPPLSFSYHVSLA